MNQEFKLLMISAMYENGGNTAHRFLDGHPQMFVYPFESQLGTRFIQDYLSSVFPLKYRWPQFPLTGTAEEDFRSIIDEETKVRARTPPVSKFRHAEFEMDDEERCALYREIIARTGRSRGLNVAAFFRSTFEAWKNRRKSGSEYLYVGYSPVVVVDTAKILADFATAHVLHIVRNPWSAYADTKKRPVPLSLERYAFSWCLNQFFALYYREKYPGRVHVIRYEDLVYDPAEVLGRFCEKTGAAKDEILGTPTWNGGELESVAPWGTIVQASAEANRHSAAALSPEEKESIRAMTWQYLDGFGYKNFL